MSDEHAADRAWLTAGGDLESWNDGPDLFRLDVENHGRTAAFIKGYTIRFARLAELMAEPAVRPLECSHRHIDGLSPNGARKQIHTGIARPPQADVVFGAVWYEDVWGEKHVSRFLLRIAAIRDIPGHGWTRLDNITPGVSDDYWSWG